jgi:hypothetical protein
MKTLIATASVTIALLSVGAVANDYAFRAPTELANVTVIAKNQAWPLKTQMTVEPCRVTQCVSL